MSQKRIKQSKPVPLKHAPLSAIGVGMSDKDTKAIAADLEARLANLSCCQAAVLRVGLVCILLNCGIGDLCQMRDDLNHLIEDDVEKDGKRTYKISRALMGIMERKEPVQ